MEPLYNFEFKLVITGTGEDPNDAWGVALDLLREDLQTPDIPRSIPMPDEYSRKEIVSAIFKLECDACGFIENRRDDDMGEWFPEAWLGDVCVGCVCPTCARTICTFDEENSVMDIQMDKIDFRLGYSPLAKLISDIMTHYRQTTPTESV